MWTFKLNQTAGHKMRWFTVVSYAEQRRMFTAALFLISLTPHSLLTPPSWNDSVIRKFEEHILFVSHRGSGNPSNARQQFCNAPKGENLCLWAHTAPAFYAPLMYTEKKKKKKNHLLKKAAEAKPDNSYLYAYSDKICTHFWYTLVANTKERILGSTQEFPSQARLCSSGTADVLLFNMRKCRILFVFLLEII